MDLTKLSDADLLALKANDYSKMSDEGLKALKASSSTQPEEPSAIKDVAMQLPTGFNEGLADTVGAPVDAVNWGLGKIGLPTNDTPFLGSKSIKKALGWIGANPDNALPQTAAGQFARAASSTAASALVPEASVGLLAKTSLLSPNALRVAQSVAGDGSAPLATAASGAAAGVGSEAAGQATEGTAAEPYARIGGAMLGGAVAAKLAAKRAATPLQAKPTIDDVKAEASSLYNDPVVKDLRVDPRAVRSAGHDISQRLQNDAFFPEDHGPVFNQLSRLQRANGPVSYDQLDAVRKQFNDLAGQTNEGRPTATAKAAIRAKSMLDDFIANDMTDPANVLQGNPVAARVFMHNARQNAGAAIRADIVSKKLGNAAVDTQTANSAMNLDNKSRQSLKSFLKNDEAKMAGFNDAEREAMRRMVLGDTLRNTIRYAGNAIGGSGITVGPYVLMGHPALPAVGYGLKKAANMMAERSGKNLTDLLLSRAPLAQRVIAQNANIKAANSAAAKTRITRDSVRAAALASLLSAQKK